MKKYLVKFYKWQLTRPNKYCVGGEADVRLVYDITTIKELEGDYGGGGGGPRVTRDLRTCLARWYYWSDERPEIISH